MTVAAEEYFRLFEQYRGFRPVAEKVETGADGITRIKIKGFTEVDIGRNGGWSTGVLARSANARG